jgi:hypothetical protein
MLDGDEGSHTRSSTPHTALASCVLLLVGDTKPGELQNHEAKKLWDQRHDADRWRVLARCNRPTATKTYGRPLAALSLSDPMAAKLSCVSPPKPRNILQLMSAKKTTSVRALATAGHGAR